MTACGDSKRSLPQIESQLAEAGPHDPAAYPLAEAGEAKRLPSLERQRGTARLGQCAGMSPKWRYSFSSLALAPAAWPGTRASVGKRGRGLSSQYAAEAYVAHDGVDHLRAGGRSGRLGLLAWPQ